MLSIPPEICALIAVQVRTSELAHLALTSRAMLDRFVPYVWENVKAECLLALLQGARFEQVKSRTGSRGVFCFEIVLGIS